MFCTQCGTEIDPAKKFCKGCGASIARKDADETAELNTNEELPHGAAVSPLPASGAEELRASADDSPPRSARRGNKTVPLAIAAALLVLAGAGVYFGTRPAPGPIESPPPAAQEPVAGAPDSVPSEPLPNFADSNETPAGAENPPAAVTGAAGVEAPRLVEQPRPPAIDKPKPGPVETPRRAPAPQQRAAQEPPRAGRPAASARATASAGVYETLRSTAVHEDPSSSARVVANIPAGVRVNVVASTGDWLEVHSRRGNPPGFIRRGDAVFVEGAN